MMVDLEAGQFYVRLRDVNREIWVEGRAIPRSPAQPRESIAKAGSPPEGRSGAPGAFRHRRDNGYLQPRPTGNAGTGGSGLR